MWGIYHGASHRDRHCRQASIDKVAVPSASAIMTAFGLAVAVPAVLGYNWLVRRNKVAWSWCGISAAAVPMTLLGGPRTERKGA